MWVYIFRRLLQLIPVLISVTLMVFILINIIPADPVMMMLGMDATEEQVEILRSKLGLDQPLWKRYIDWMGGIVRGDFGRSYRDSRPVLPTLLQRFPATLELLAGAMIIALGVAIPVGVLSGVKPNSPVDYLGRFFALLGVSMPGFWLGMILIILFAYKWTIFPPSGRGGIEHLILPSLSLGAIQMGFIMRLTRSTMLEVINSDYIRTARAKGLRERIVVFKHALRNAVLPIITMVSIQCGYLLAGSIVVETLFSWPGIGRFTFQRMMQRDYPVLMGNVLLYAFLFALINLLTDLSYAFFDPRIRYE